METFADNDGHSWHEPEESSENMTFTLAGLDEIPLAPWDKTDRPLRLPARPRPNHSPTETAHAHEGDRQPARSQWLKEHDIHTQFVDVGVGCCWFAQQGDHEPVSGETEDEALARLAQETGLEWRDAREPLVRRGNA